MFLLAPNPVLQRVQVAQGEWDQNLISLHRLPGNLPILKAKPVAVDQRIA